MRPSRRLILFCLVHAVSLVLALGTAGLRSAVAATSPAGHFPHKVQCCCGTPDGRCCGMACCGTKAPAPERQSSVPAPHPVGGESLATIPVRFGWLVDSERSIRRAPTRCMCLAPSWRTLQHQATRLNI